MLKPEGSHGSPPIQDQLTALRSREKELSAQMQDYSLQNPDQAGYANLYYRLENIRLEIQDLTNSIPSAGPSPTTRDFSNQDPQGRRPVRRGR